MLEAVLTAVNLAIFAVCFTVGTAKAAAARSDRDTTLQITASVLLCASVVYLLSTPAVYRLVGAAAGSPSLPSLLVSIAILACVGHAHALTFLWHPRRRSPHALRRAMAVWAPMYGLAIATMTVLFWWADLSGPARPLSFATSYAHVPAAFALEMVYLGALVVGIVATVRQCRGPDGVIALPGRPDLAESLRLFALAVGLDLAYVACTATAVITAARGEHALDFLTAVGSVASSISALVASYGLAKPALAARAAERADHETLLALWETVTAPDAHGSAVPSMTWWNRRYALADLLAEILDATYSLRPWMSAAPAEAVTALARSHPDANGLDVKALQTAAMIHHARQRRDDSNASELPAPLGPNEAPREDTPPALERARQVRIAVHLSHPLVAEALKRLA
ncbi:hypothetical protein ADK57_17690 [Streptomyces sp. MMG1533]|uniref:DUF6545 domain-containing protein n=1 Tax=Streptomyces sp. MMG1533 TaxID=1415546 RepID=UPI0006AE99F4|nr:DUF6545 domain-containing protein [Streptomyces sp. MMG1533]KOU66817.1 hypothetical protein ADK57_17690 [Streptomyces sp. MMG1533]